VSAYEDGSRVLPATRRRRRPSASISGGHASIGASARDMLPERSAARRRASRVGRRGGARLGCASCRPSSPSLATTRGRRQEPSAGGSGPRGRIPSRSRHAAPPGRHQPNCLQLELPTELPPRLCHCAHPLAHYAGFSRCPLNRGKATPAVGEDLMFRHTGPVGTHSLEAAQPTVQSGNKRAPGSKPATQGNPIPTQIGRALRP
jgi:hypothetical protein